MADTATPINRRLAGRVLGTAVLMGTMVLMLSGCTSYYSHYSVFPAYNSAGEPRNVRVSWESAESSGIFSGVETTAIRVETQCSERVLILSDQALRDESGKGGECGPGIRGCGEPRLDQLVSNGKPATSADRCFEINPGADDQGIGDLGRSLELLVHCQPAQTSVGEGDDAVNMDYLRASTVPYVVDVRKTPKGDLRARAPRLSTSVCNE